MVDAAVVSTAGSGELFGRVLGCRSFEHVPKAVLQPVSRALNATSSVFLQFFNVPLRRDCVRRDYYIGNAPESVDTYLGGYYEVDPLIAGGLRALRSDAPERSGFVTLLSGFPSSREATQYTRFLRRFDIGHVLGILVPVRTLNRNELMCLGFHRSQEGDAFSDREVRLMRQLMPLLQTVLSNLAYRDATELSATLLDAISGNGSGVGFVVLDEDLLVCHANQRGLAQLGLHRGPATTAGTSSGFFGELRERLLRAPLADGHCERLSLGIPEGDSSALTAIQVEVRTFKSSDGRTNYLLLTSTPDERCALQESCHQVGLSDREVEVARLVCAGQSNAQIGRQLGITFRTVENHLRSVYAKVGVHTRTQLVSRLLRAQ